MVLFFEVYEKKLCVLVLNVEVSNVIDINSNVMNSKT